MHSGGQALETPSRRTQQNTIKRRAAFMLSVACAVGLLASIAVQFVDATFQIYEKEESVGQSCAYWGEKKPTRLS